VGRDAHRDDKDLCTEIEGGNKLYKGRDTRQGTRTNKKIEKNEKAMGKKFKKQTGNPKLYVKKKELAGRPQVAKKKVISPKKKKPGTKLQETMEWTLMIENHRGGWWLDARKKILISTPNKGNEKMDG